MPIDLSAQPLALLLAIFAAAGAVVWIAGTRLTGLVDTLVERTGLGRAFAGMLLLGGITSLPEVATVATASATGNPALALNNLLGSASINVLLLAICDQFFGRAPLTVMMAKPVTLMQGVLGMLLLAGVVVAAASGDFVLPGLQIGIGSLLLAAGCIQALRMAARFERQHVWDAVDPPHEEGDAHAGGAPEDSVGRPYCLGGVDDPVCRRSAVACGRRDRRKNGTGRLAGRLRARGPWSLAARVELGGRCAQAQALRDGDRRHLRHQPVQSC